MATSGSFSTNSYKSGGNAPKYYTFNWNLISQSIEGNYSDIAWSLIGAGGDANYWVNVKEKYATVDGENHSNSTIQQTYNGTVAFSGTKRIYHNSDGTKSFSASAGGAFQYYGSYNSTGSGSWDLPQIARQANITSATDFNDEQNPTINYNNPAGNNVTSLQACISLTGAKDDVIYRDISKTGTSYTFNLTEAERNVLRNATTGKSRSVIFYVRTIIGGTTFHSTSTKTLTITNANPTLGIISYKDSNNTTTAITGNNQRIIRNNSNIVFTFGTATAKKGASISKYQVTIAGVTKERTSAGDIDFGKVNLSSNATATIKVTDSRGNTASSNITVIIDDWVLPTGLISMQRKNNFYSETYIKVDGSYSSLNNKNTMTITCKYKKVTDNTYTSTSLQDNVEKEVVLDNTYQWNIVVTITDKIGSTTYNLLLDRGMPIIFFDRYLASIGVNCFPTKRTSLEVDGEVIANNVQQKPTILYDNAAGTAGNVTLSQSVADFEYIEIFFALYGSKYSTNSNKVYLPNGKECVLSTVSFDTSTSSNPAYIMHNKIVKISEASIEVNSYKRMWFYNNDTKPTIDSNNEIYIYRVIGYK